MSLVEGRAFGSSGCCVGAGLVAITAGPAAGFAWLFFAILNCVFVVKANAVFVAATFDFSRPRTLRSVLLGLNIGAIAPLLGLLVLVSAPVTLVKLGRAVRERPKFADEFARVRWLGIASLLIYVLLYVVLGILVGVRYYPLLVG